MHVVMRGEKSGVRPEKMSRPNMGDISVYSGPGPSELHFACFQYLLPCLVHIQKSPPRHVM